MIVQNSKFKDIKNPSLDVGEVEDSMEGSAASYLFSISHQILSLSFPHSSFLKLSGHPNSLVRIRFASEYCLTH